MLLRYIAAFALLFLIGCSGPTESKTDEKLLSDLEEEKTWIDSIELGTPLEFLSDTSAAFEYPEYTESQLNFSNPISTINTFPTADTLTNEPGNIDTIYDIKPEVVDTEPFIAYVKHPVPQKAGPLMSSQNASEHIQYLDVAQGLSSDRISIILEDPNGFLWIATYRGLVLYDGNYFHNYTTEHGLIHDDINDMIYDDEGNLWIATMGGLQKYDGHKFETYTVENGLKSNHVRSLCQDQDGDMWFCSYDKAATELSDGKMTHYTHEMGLKGGPRLVQIDYKNRPMITYWYAVPDFIEGDKIVSYLQDGSNNRYFGSQMILNIGKTKDGEIWTAAYNGGMNVLPKGDGPSRRYHPKSGKNSPACFYMMEDSKSRKWFTVGDGGVAMLSNDEYKGYTTKQGLTSNTTALITEDRGGNMWIGTDGGGVNKIIPSSFRTYTVADGFTEAGISGITHDRFGRIYVSTANSFWVLNDDHFERYRGGSISTSVYTDIFGNVILGGHQFGTPYYRVTEGDTVALADRFNIGKDGIYRSWNVHAMCNDKEGNLWLGDGLYGLFKLDINSSKTGYDKIHNYTSGNTEMHSNVILHLLGDSKGNVWMGHPGTGISRIKDDKIEHFTEANGLSSNGVLCLTEMKDGSIWLGTSEGITIMDGDNFRYINKEDGLLERTVQSIFEDPSGRVWVGTIKGLYMLSPDESKDCGYAMTTFGMQDGLKSSYFERGVVTMTDDQKLYWGTAKGLVMLDLKDFEKKLSPPEVSITSLQLMDSHVDFNALKDSIASGTAYRVGEGEKDISQVEYDEVLPFYNVPKTITLPYNVSTVTFNYSSLGGNAPYHIKYRYRLRGLEDVWSAETKHSSAKYSNLRAGEYTFEVQAKVQNGEWGETTAYNFTVLPPWWQTWWAYIMYVLIGIGIMIAYSRWRNIKLRARQKELETEIDKATVEIRHQKEEIELQHQEIRDSIDYAKRIQSAILPPVEYLSEYIPESFILYKPKDVVAGDFYWMEEVGDKLLFAAADCTGHGVPGAMVSVVCNHALNRAVREFGCTEPGSILDKARELVIEEFEKSGEAVKDGMDIALCSINRTTGDLEYAGAHNPLWIIRKGGQEVEETKANKQPIGKFDNPEPYTTHKVKIEKGDTVYVFSDGYADQFGGEKGKKFKGANFKRLLLGLQDSSLSEQMKSIDDAFEEWRGPLEQLDDVCVIGIRL